ncbi:alpha/beta hydrolase [Prauserella halophila]|uniref:Alpha/beta hydrolase n=1 Tax=Prauserella halophila TaxID=185641 RepID=A0ABN1W2Y6_9PSEU|nr:alpha/beta hydrolase [Prauserella halophila]MCP2236389.1 Alpha/beta hydrolase family protein [Prauserella halophila]
MPATTPHPPAVVLLVHGAHHGAWCWRRVVDGLASRGVRGEALELPLTTYDDDVAAVRADVERLRRDGPLVVVAHSYSGIVVADAAHAASRLVFVAARLPLPGESQTALSQSWHGDGMREALVRDDDGWVHPTPAARDAFYPDCPDEVATDAVSRLRPMKSAVPAEPLEDPAWTRAPTAYIVCRRDRVVRVDRQRERASHVGEHHELDSGHSPFLAVPDELAALLAGQAQKTRATTA